MTPQEQNRALADEGFEYAGLDEYPGAVLIRDLSTALRDAADRLDAVQVAYRELEAQRDRYVRRYNEQSDELRAALTTPTDQEAGK